MPRWFLVLFSLCFVLAAGLFASPAMAGDAQHDGAHAVCAVESPGHPPSVAGALDHALVEPQSDIPELVVALAERPLAGVTASVPRDAGIAQYLHPILDGPRRPPRGSTFLS